VKDFEAPKELLLEIWEFIEIFNCFEY